MAKEGKRDEIKGQTSDEKLDEKDASDTENADKEFADLVPNEGNYRGSSRTDIHYENISGEDECPPVTQNNADQKGPDSGKKCEYLLPF